MIPAPPGTTAYYEAPAYSGSTQMTERQLPVVALDDELGALVLDQYGRLVTPGGYSRTGWNFRAVHVPTTDPVVAIERLADPVTVATAGGLDAAIGWAFRASGEVAPIVESAGTPWVYPDEWEPWKPNARDLQVAS